MIDSNPSAFIPLLASCLALVGTNGANAEVTVLGAPCAVCLPPVGTAGYATVTGFGRLTLGNEVVTIVPEPATAALLGLGLGLLGLAGGGGSIAARARRSRRP